MLMRLRAVVLLPGFLVVMTGCDFKGISPPILVSERDSLLDKGRVFLVTNTSDRPLHGVRVSVTSVNGVTHSYHSHTVGAHDTFEVGWMELNKWQPPANSVVDISVSGYILEAEYQ